MKTAVSTLLWLLCFSCVPCLAAQDPFKIIYRQENVKITESDYSANVMINVFNNSGEDASELTVAIPETNDLLFHTLPTTIGDVPNGHMVEILVPIDLPTEAATPVPQTGEMTWALQYRSPAGEYKTVDLVGKRGL